MPSDQLDKRVEDLEKQLEGLQKHTLEVTLASVPAHIDALHQRLETLSTAVHGLDGTIAYVKRYGSVIAAAVAIASAVVPSYMTQRTSSETQRMVARAEDSKQLHDLLQSALDNDSSVGLRAATLAGLCNAAPVTGDEEQQRRIRGVAQTVGRALAQTCDYECNKEKSELGAKPTGQGTLAVSTDMDCGVVCDMVSCLFIGKTTNNKACTNAEESYEYDELACTNQATASKVASRR
jgi:hypothetical protein